MDANLVKDLAYAHNIFPAGFKFSGKGFSDSFQINVKKEEQKVKLAQPYGLITKFSNDMQKAAQISSDGR